MRVLAATVFDDAQRAVLSSGLPIPVEGAVAVPDPAVGGLLAWVDREGLDGTLWRAVERGTIEGGDALRRAALELHRRRQHHALAVEATTVRAVEALADHGIDAWAMKGVAAAHLDYADPELRSFADCDLLVRRGSFAAAITALEGAGWRRQDAAPPRWWEARFARTVTLRRQGEPEVDLHAAIAEGYFGARLDPGSLVEPAEVVALAGCPVPVLAKPARLVVAAYEVQLNRGPRLRLLRDLARLLLGDEGDEVWRAAADLAGAAGGEAVLAGALQTVLGIFPILSGHAALGWASSVTPSPVAARALALAEAVERVGWRAAARSTLLALPAGEHAPFLAGLTVHAIRTRLGLARPAAPAIEPERPLTAVGSRLPAPKSVLLLVKGLDIGGVERVVVDLAAGVRRRGVDAHVAVAAERRDALVAELRGAEVPVHGLGGSDLFGVRAAWRLRRLAGRRFEVVHAHGPLPTLAARTILARRAAIVSTFHTPWAALHAPVRWLLRATARLDHSTVAVSSAVAASCPPAVAARMQVVPHGVDTDRATTARAGDWPAAAGAVRALIVASHRDAKNYPNLLAAVRVAIDRGARLSVRAIGDGPGLAEHQRLAAGLGLGEVVRFEPPTPDPWPVFAAADLLVVASDFEGQPLVVSEALAVGCPIVATSVGRVPELVTPEVGRVVPPSDPNSLGAAIADLAGDPQTRAAMRRAALDRAGGWTLDDVVDAHLDLYRRALSP